MIDAITASDGGADVKAAQAKQLIFQMNDYSENKFVEVDKAQAIPSSQRDPSRCPLVADVAFALTSASPRYDPTNEPLIVEDVIGTLASHTKRHGHAMTTHQAAEAGQLIPFDPRQITSKDNRTRCEPGDPCGTLHGTPPAIAIADDPIVFQTRIARNGRGQPDSVVGALVSAESGSHGDSKPHVTTAAGVRRLTPLECERCQGMPDEWTKYGMTEGGKKIKLSDSARYRLIGNSVAIPTVAWIVRRIAAIGTT